MVASLPMDSGGSFLASNLLRFTHHQVRYEPKHVADTLQAVARQLLGARALVA